MQEEFPVAVYDDIAEVYDQSRGGATRGRRFAEAISPLLVPGGVSIELGVGTGVVAAGLAELGHTVVGIDLSSGMLRRARERLGGSVGLATIDSLPFQSGAAGNCYAVWVLHMVADLERALREVYRTLRPGGRLVTCSVNNGPADDAISQIVFEMQLALIGESVAKRDTDPELRHVAKRVGFIDVPGVQKVVQSYGVAPHAVASTIEARGFSSLRDIDDASWRSIVAPAIEDLRALPDSPIVRNTVHELSVFERESTD